MLLVLLGLLLGEFVLQLGLLLGLLSLLLGLQQLLLRPVGVVIGEHDD